MPIETPFFTDRKFFQFQFPAAPGASPGRARCPQTFFRAVDVVARQARQLVAYRDVSVVLPVLAHRHHSSVNPEMAAVLAQVFDDADPGQPLFQPELHGFEQRRRHVGVVERTEALADQLFAAISAGFGKRVVDVGNDTAVIRARDQRPVAGAIPLLPHFRRVHVHNFAPRTKFIIITLPIAALSSPRRSGIPRRPPSRLSRTPGIGFRGVAAKPAASLSGRRRCRRRLLTF